MVGTVMSASMLGANALILGEDGAEFTVKPMPDGRILISASSAFGTIHNRLDAVSVLTLRDFLNAWSEQLQDVLNACLKQST
jgi:hypothetical protein